MAKKNNYKTTQRTNQIEGMPEIAERSQKNPLIFLILIMSLIILGMNIYLHHKKSNKKISELDETYSVEGGTNISLPSSPVKQSEPSPITNTLTPNQMAIMQEKRRELQQRLAAPLMLIRGEINQVSHSLLPTVPRATDVNMQFMKQVSQQANDTVKATHIGPLNYVIAEGNLIHAILETAINSDLPGYIRAVVNQPVYSEDGTQVLIPPGSRLIGQYRSGMLQGQTRVFIAWTRVIIPGGISINIASPGVDNLGMAGMGADSVDHHFWQQFGTAILLSIIGAGTSNIDVGENNPYNAAQAYRIALANSLSQTANQTLRQTGAIPPTLWINQGKPVMVFVAHDLNFQQAMQQAKPKINIF